MPTYEQKNNGTGQQIETASQLEAVFDAMADGVFVFDDQGHIIRTNTAGRELLGGEELYRSPSSSLREGAERFHLRDAHGVPLTEVQWPVPRLLRGEEIKGTDAMDMLVHTLAGQDRLLNLSGGPIRDVQGKIVGGVMIVRDVTERVRMEEARHRSEEQYRTIVQTANEGIWLFNRNAETMYANERMAAMLGYSNEELQTRTFMSCIFPEDVAMARLRINSNLLGEREQFEFRFRRCDGTPLDTLASTTPTYDADGSIIGVLCLFTDITAHKQVEEALKQSEEMLRFALRNSPISVFRQDLDLRYTWMYNPPSATPEAVIGKTDADFVRPEVASYLTQRKRHVLTSGESIREEVQIPTANGPRFQQLTFEPLRDNVGGIIGLTGTSINITEQKLLEQRTHRALEALLAMARVMVQETNPEPETSPTTSALNSVSQRIAILARDVLGCARLCLYQIESGTERMLPLAVVGLAPELEPIWWASQEQNTAPLSSRWEASVVAQLRQQEVLTLDLTHPPYNKYPNPYGTRSVLIAPLNLNGELLGLLELDYEGEDHTYSSEEIALAQAAGRIMALVIEREQLLTERTEARVNEIALREANHMKDEFIGIAGHELRTPLTTIKASVQLAQRQLKRIMLQEEQLSSDVAKSVKTIQDLLNRTERQIGMQNRLVNDLLDIARVETGRLELYPTLCDIIPLVNDVIEDQRYLTPSRTLTLVLPATPELLVMADADRLRQVISNYLSNALKYSGADKPVAVSIETSNTHVRVSVRDEGPGLADSQQQHVWERFYRVPGIEVKTGLGVGLGLGLHISRMIIERQHGQVGIESQMGQGSTFWFTLPLAELP